MLQKGLQSVHKMFSEFPKMIERQSRQFYPLKTPESPLLTIMSYNILAPSAIEKHLYPHHSAHDLDTNKRFKLILS